MDATTVDLAALAGGPNAAGTALVPAIHERSPSAFRPVRDSVTVLRACVRTVPAALR